MPENPDPFAIRFETTGGPEVLRAIPIATTDPGPPYILDPFDAMRKNVANGDVALAAGLELGPVVGDRGVVVERAAIREDVHRGGEHALGRRERHRQGVGVPPAAASVGGAGPDVDDLAAAVVDADGSAAAALDVSLEYTGDFPKVRIDVTVDHSVPRFASQRVIAAALR